MIKPNELRIGNLVTDEFSRVITVDSIYCMGINISPATAFGALSPIIKTGYIFEQLTGILLTEEWLLKFGFHEKYKSTCNRWYKRSESLNSGCELIDPENEETGESTTGRFLHDYQLEIKYVHQLQNFTISFKPF